MRYGIEGETGFGDGGVTPVSTNPHEMYVERVLEARRTVSVEIPPSFVTHPTDEVQGTTIATLDYEYLALTGISRRIPLDKAT